MYALEGKFLALTAAFRFVVFGLMVAGLLVRMSKRAQHSDELVRPVARAIVITALLASQAWWFPLVEKTFFAAAVHIQFDYLANPTGIADQIRESATPNPESASWSLTGITESLYNAFTQIITWAFVGGSTLLALVMLFLQQVLRWVLYFLTPFALGCFMIPALCPLATRFFQQLLAILAWPVGFALTNIVTISLWQDFRNTVGFDTGTKLVLTQMPVLNNTGYLLAGIALIVGTLSTPIVCHMLFSSGAALTGAASSPVALMRGTTNALSQVAGAITNFKTLGALAAVKTASAAVPQKGSDGSAAKPPPLPAYSNPFLQPPGL